MSSRGSRAPSFTSIVSAGVLACTLVCVVCGPSAYARAQADTEIAQVLPGEGSGPVHDDYALERLRRAVEHARFDEARRLATGLLARPRLAARTRNDALELLAVAQIAARDEEAASVTLRELYTRDPQHPERLDDPGPAVEGAFARSRRARVPAPSVPLTSTVVRDTYGRTVVVVQLGPGSDAVDEVHVFAWSSPELPPTHLVAEVGTRDLVTLALPTSPPGAVALALYVEARAPSGSVLGGEGSREEPLRAALPTPPLCQKAGAPPLQRAWWLWTSVAIVVAGIGVAGAVAAH